MSEPDSTARGGQDPTRPVPGQAALRAVPPAPTTSAIVLAVLSGVAALGTCFFLGLPSGILGILAATTAATDPAGSRRKTRIGWWVFAVNVLLCVAALVAFVLVLRGMGSPYDPRWDPYATPSDIGY